MAPPDEPRGPGREPPATASGLDESQIDERDLQALRDAVHLNTLAPEITPGKLRSEVPELSLPGARLHEVTLRLDRPQFPALRIVALPEKAQMRTPDFRLPAVKLHRDLPLALARSIRRRKLRPDDLRPEQQHALYTALFEKYGAAARGIEVQAVFAHVPPEAAEHVAVDPALAWAAFTLPPGLAPGRARAGFYLVALRSTTGETRRVLLRL